VLLQMIVEGLSGKKVSEEMKKVAGSSEVAKPFTASSAEEIVKGLGLNG
jgi:hypothetical protein